MTGIVDQALKTDGNDSLGLGTYTQALLDFIEKTGTPMTIGVQGEWGSGKTSLLNQIWNGLEKRDVINEQVKYKQIWINAWEHSLLCSPEECLIKIINEIISELVSADQQKTKAEKLASGISKLAKGAARIGGAVTLGAAGKDIADDMFGEHENSIKQLREELRKLTTEIKGLESNPYDKFVIYVDDLDRIDPPDAVKILELLKNIFNIPDCIFLLAIDYQVVVKGLEAKFGKQTPENEREFKSFFDKIIQLAFKMPMSDYNIGQYISGLLKQIDFEDDEDEKLSPDLITAFVNLTISGNPRSIKRLINSLSLIKIINNLAEDQDSDFLDDEVGATIMFAMVCLQTAQPDVYNLLAEYPDFTKWDDEIAFKVTQGKEMQEETFQENYDQAIKSDDFDEDWEKALFKICYLNPTSRRQTNNISRFFSVLKDKYAEDGDTTNLTSYITKALGQSAVTSVTTKDSQNVRPPKEAWKPVFESGVEEWLEHRAPEGTDKKSTLKIVNFIKDKYNAVDFEQGKSMKEQKSEYVFKYAGGISLYYKQRKILDFYIGRNKDSLYADMRILKNPKYENQQIFLKKSNIKFVHRRKPHTFNPENQTFSGSTGYTDWLKGDFDYEGLSDVALSFIIDDLVERRENPEYQDKILKEKDVTTYAEIFKTADKNSEEFKSAYDWLLDTFSNDVVDERFVELDF